MRDFQNRWDNNEVSVYIVVIICFESTKKFMNYENVFKNVISYSLIHHTVSVSEILFLAVKICLNGDKSEYGFFNAGA
jgi:hypothetical protein